MNQSILILLVPLLLFSACNKSLVIQNVDYSQRVESVLQPDENGYVNDQRHNLAFNIRPLVFEEFEDSTSNRVDEIRLIRDQEGYYYFTATSFKHVYLLKPASGKLKLHKKVEINESGLNIPVFNRRGKHIELVDVASNVVYQLNHEGLKEGEKS